MESSHDEEQENPARAHVEQSRLFALAPVSCIPHSEILLRCSRSSTKSRGRVATLLHLSFGAMLFVASRADAQPLPTAEHDAAAASFRDAMALIERGDCPAAIDKLAESVRHEESVGAHLNLADCYERTGSNEDAWREAHAAERLALAKHDGVRRDTAHMLATNLERTLLKISFGAPTIEGLAVSLDGKALGQEVVAEGVLAIAPGSHHLEAVAPGGMSDVHDVTGNAGEVRNVSFHLESRAAPSASDGARTSRRTVGSAQRTAGWIAAGIGAVGLGVGVLAGVLAIGAKSDCDPYPNCEASPGGRDANDRAHKWATLSTIGFGAGVAGGVAGIVLILTAPKGAPASASTNRIEPVVLAGGGGMHWRVAW